VRGVGQCRFCAIVAADDPQVLVYRSTEVAAFLDTRPVFHGHCLVVPCQHIETLAELPAAAMAPLFTTVQIVMAAQGDELGAEGTFVAANNHISQAVPHLHVHVVPRRRKDGLRGFFWPRHPYPDDEALQRMRERMQAAVQQAAERG
jgi:histidine triad (HIT) family protein